MKFMKLAFTMSLEITSPVPKETPVGDSLHEMTPETIADWKKEFSKQFGNEADVTDVVVTQMEVIEV